MFAVEKKLANNVFDSIQGLFNNNYFLLKLQEIFSYVYPGQYTQYLYCPVGDTNMYNLAPYTRQLRVPLWKCLVSLWVESRYNV